MRFLKWVIDEEYSDGSGLDNAGHFEEVELTDDQIAEAIKDYIRREYTVEEDPNRDKTVKKIYDDLYRMCDDITIMFKEEVEEHFGVEIVT